MLNRYITIIVIAAVAIVAFFVGQKTQAHVQENLDLLSTPVLSQTEFTELVSKLSS